MRKLIYVVLGVPVHYIDNCFWCFVLFNKSKHVFHIHIFWTGYHVFENNSNYFYVSTYVSSVRWGIFSNKVIAWKWGIIEFSDSTIISSVFEHGDIFSW